MLEQLAKRYDVRSFGIVAVVLVGFLVAWGLYPKPRQKAANDGVTEIVYWTHPAFMEAIRPAVEEFERRNPKYRVLLGTATVRDISGDPTRFLLGVAGDVPPDVIFFDRLAIVEWASRGAFADLTPMVEKEKEVADGIHRENFFPSAYEEPVYKGRIYAIASDADTRGLYYREDALVRGGFVYKSSDPEVAAGTVAVGDARPPKSWEELCRKLIHADGQVEGDGSVKLANHVRRPAVNENLPVGAPINLDAAGVRSGDIVAVVRGTAVFRGRIGEITGADSFRIDFSREQARGLDAVPAGNRGTSEIKIFSQDGYIPKLTRFDPESGLMTEAGFIPFYGNSWLYLYGWLNGAEYMSADGTRVQLDSPEVVGALQWLTDIHDSMGGAEKVNVFQYGASSGGTEPFLAGRVPLFIDRDSFLGTIMALKPELRFGVAAPPIPEARLKRGEAAAGWSGGWAHAIPATAKHQPEAWELIRWLSSVEANRIIAESQASLRRAKGQTYFPSLHSDRRVIEWLQKRYVTDAPAVSPSLRKAYAQFVELLPKSRFRPVTPVGQLMWNEHVRAAEAGVNHAKTPYEALNYGTRQVQVALDRALHPPQGPLVNWTAMSGLYLLLIVIVTVVVIAQEERNRRITGGSRREWVEGFICISPWLLGFLVFAGGPILFSLVVSFCHYDVLSPARWIGIDNYRNLVGTHYDDVVKARVANDPLFWKSLWNTLFMIVKVPLEIILGMALALLLNLNVGGQRVYRTIFYLPAIVPAVASFLLWFWIFDPSLGLLNQGLRAIGVGDPPSWLLDPNWAKPSLIIMLLWGTGSSMVIWLAGLKDIPEVYYEAASVDGANRLQQFRHVTLPMLSPYILFNAVMGMIGALQTFEAAYVMTNGGPADSTLFYSYKLFNEAFKFLNMGPASAMAWFLFIVVLIVTLVQLWAGKRWVHYGD